MGTLLILFGKIFIKGDATIFHPTMFHSIIIASDISYLFYTYIILINYAFVFLQSSWQTYEDVNYYVI
jgi:hypothetical protein